MTNKESFMKFRSASQPRVQVNLPEGEYKAIPYSMTEVKGKITEDGEVKDDYYAISLKVVLDAEVKTEGFRLFYPRSIYNNFHDTFGALLQSYLEVDANTEELVQLWAESCTPIKIKLSDPDEPNQPSRVQLLFKNTKQTEVV